MTRNITDNGFISEANIRQWVKEAIKEYFHECAQKLDRNNQTSAEPLISRKETAQRLKISLVTLNSWRKDGMPYHRQKRKVYYLWSEVLDHMKKKKNWRLSLINGDE